MTEISSSATATSDTAPEPRPGIPVWRVGKPDSFLADDVAAARAAVATIASDAAIGRHLGARSEGVRCVTHLFESKQPGYSGWVWFASLSRISRGKESTVNEVGMLPTEDAVLAPAWVPWAERVRPEDQEDAEAAGAASEQAASSHQETDHQEAHDDGADAGTPAAGDQGWAAEGDDTSGDISDAAAASGNAGFHADEDNS